MVVWYGTGNEVMLFLRIFFLSCAVHRFLSRLEMIGMLPYPTRSLDPAQTISSFLFFSRRDCNCFH